MSRGLGKWQRLILKTLQAQEAVFLCELLPKGQGRRSPYSLCYSQVLRAMRTLEKRGAIVVQRSRKLRYPCPCRVFLTRPDVVIPMLTWARHQMDLRAEKYEREHLSVVNNCS
jgi:hypothetical protein